MDRRNDNTMTQKTVTFEIDGKPHTIALTTNGMARYQKEMGESTTAGFAEIEKEGFDAVRLRAMFWAMLPEGTATIDEAGDMMDAVGIQMAAALIGQTAKAAFQQPGKPQTRKPKS